MAIVKGIPDREKRRWQRIEASRRGKGPVSNAPGNKTPAQGSAGFRKVAKLVKLSVVHDRVPTMVGNRHGCAVSVVGAAPGSRGARWVLKVTHDGVPQTVHISPETSLRKAAKLFTGEDILTGDGDFDAKVFMQGDAASLIACLDTQNRRRTLTVLAFGAVIKGSVLKARFQPDDMASVVADNITQCLRLMHALARRPDLSKVHLRNAQRDDSSGARLRNAMLLWQARPATVAAKRVALGRDPLVRTWLCRVLDEPIKGVERFVDTCVGHPETPPELRSWACRQLASSPLEERTVKALWAMLAEEDDDRRMAHLITEIGRKADPDAMEPLVELGTGMLRPRVVKDAARRAIAAIERRSGRVQQGGLALSDGGSSGGGLSAPAEVGATALADD